MKFILASSSPRREGLLRKAGYDFEVRPSGVEEGEPDAGELPEDFARRMARAKALAVAGLVPAGNWVLGADTVVTLDGLTLGKPHGPAEATDMLRLLSGCTHQVITAICLVKAPGHIQALTHETTQVTFAELSDQDIREYVSTPEPYDKAGGYAVQGLASRFVTHISGSHSNVVGLPIPLLGRVLRSEEAHQNLSPKGAS